MQKTIKNLAKAYIGESQARNRYTTYAKKAKDEGYIQISQIFLETADQEREHAAKIFDMIQRIKSALGEREDQILVDASTPTSFGSTEENLQAAAKGEHYEYSEMYPEFADIAEAEGLLDVAGRLRSIAIAETHHEERYLKLYQQLKDGTMFKKSEETIWICMECGYQYKGKQPPEKCPSCDHEKGYYKVKCENY